MGSLFVISFSEMFCVSFDAVAGVVFGDLVLSLPLFLLIFSKISWTSTRAMHKSHSS